MMAYIFTALKGSPQGFKLRKVNGSILVHVRLPDQSPSLVSSHFASHLCNHHHHQSSFYCRDHNQSHLLDHCDQFIRGDAAIPVRVDQGESLNKGNEAVIGHLTTNSSSWAVWCLTIIFLTCVPLSNVTCFVNIFSHNTKYVWYFFSLFKWKNIMIIKPKPYSLTEHLLWNKIGIFCTKLLSENMNSDECSWYLPVWAPGSSSCDCLRLWHDFSEHLKRTPHTPAPEKTVWHSCC